MRMFDEASLTPVEPPSPSDIGSLREREGASEAVFERYRVAETTVAGRAAD